MRFEIQLQLFKNQPGVPYVIVGFVVATLVSRLLRGPNLDAFPAVGLGKWLGSWWAAFNWNAASDIQEGCRKYKSAPFRFVDRFNWIVVFSKPEHAEELLRAPEDTLSLTESARDILNIQYTLGDEFLENPYHIAVIRSQLTQSIGTIYPAIRNEIVMAFDETLNLTGNEWKTVLPLSIVQKVICRTSNRLFVAHYSVGRDPDWIDLNIQFTVDVLKTGATIALFPKFLRPLAARFLPGATRGKLRALRHLGPIIEERFKCWQNEAEMPADLVSWLIEEAKDSSLTLGSLIDRVLLINIAAIHTSALSFTLALFYLAINPQYIQPLREEAEHVIGMEGWSKAAVAKMHKVDSFLRECLRIEGLGFLGPIRKAMKDFTFSDGTFVPKGTMIGIASQALHHNNKFYENASSFEPFRFAKMPEDKEGVKHQFASTGMGFLLFGHGKHACPGRFFVANQLKTMLAHVILAFDIKLEGNATREPSLHIGYTVVPNPCMNLLFRRRAD